MLFFILLLVVLIIVFVVLGAYVVNQQTAAVIERFGRYLKSTGPGLHVKIPVIDTIAAKVSLRTNQSEFTISAKTADNVTIGMRVAVQYCVDATEQGIYDSFYKLSNPVEQMNSYIIDALRSAIPNYTLDAVYEAKDDIAQGVQQQVADRMRGYGYIIQSTLITGIALPSDVEDSMNRINSAQREKEAAQALAEAERIKVVTEARAHAEAMEQAGIGIANQRKAIATGIAESLDAIKASGVSTQEANTLFLFTQWTDMMTDFAKTGRTSTVVLPSDFNSTASMFEQLLAANTAERGDEING